MKLREKITQRMDDLQRMNPDKVAIQISSVSKYWSVLDDEDRDYIHGARHALEEKTEWRIK